MTNSEIQNARNAGTTDFGIVMGELHRRCTKSDLYRMLCASGDKRYMPSESSRTKRQWACLFAERMYDFDENGNVNRTDTNPDRVLYLGIIDNYLYGNQ